VISGSPANKNKANLMFIANLFSPANFKKLEMSYRDIDYSVKHDVIQEII